MTAILFPYPIPPGELRLEVKRVLVDGVEPSQYVLAMERRSVDLDALDGSPWRRVRLSLVADLPAGARENLDALVQDATITIVAQCRSTNLRVTSPMQVSALDPGTWWGDLELDRELLRGPVSIIATLAGRTAGRDHRVIWRAEPWEVRTDRPAISPITGVIEMRWEDFREPSPARAHLKQWEDVPHYLDLTGAAPILCLNLGIPHLRTLLTAEGGGPAVEALKHGVATSIAATAWHTMFTSAIASVAASHDDAEEGEIPSMPAVQWQAQALSALLPLMYPKQSAEDSLATCVAAIRSPDGAAAVYALALAAAHEKAKAGSNLRKAMTYAFEKE